MLATILCTHFFVRCHKIDYDNNRVDDLSVDYIQQTKTNVLYQQQSSFESFGVNFCHPFVQAVQDHCRF